ncbi:SAM-dependent methyltransferase [Pseudomonas fluorescens NCIMB 11764]|uniref:SAM-dependent methyltransferase n=1 Tax=Pseudomonas fluorescens NCIMB 11764 TaxID=1221522 RepID=A0A0K1QSD7_PSEFL|nr:class I SAM-dependent methyltransferase [Pseudomonas fluorescens]AKV08623.1 SAM-dependent methyltransferase [Pseudomonas fluorescens NCIMB 11764]MDZ4327177.1 class I SAM-dependent methyltransferase [Pseudomonas sp.]
MKQVHHSAAAGYKTAADTYVRGRPDYPPQVADWLTDTLGLNADKSVVDLGAGTGKFTGRLVATGALVIAVEPVPQMLEKLSEAWPDVLAVSGTATDLPLPDASVDVVICAQAFHWFASGEALTEIARVLKPGGKLGLVWNLRDTRVSWVPKLDAIVNALEGDTPRFYTGAWRRAFPHAAFGPLQEQQFSHGHTGAPEDVIFNRVRSTSFVSALPAAERAKVDEQMRVLVDAEPELRGKDVVTVPYVTAAFVAVKVS